MTTRKRKSKVAEPPPEPPPPEEPHRKGLLLIPPNVAELARLAAKDVGRYSMMSMLVRQTIDGYRVEATDGKVLGVAEGVGFDPGKSISDLPNGSTEALLPAREFAKALKEGRPHAQVQLGWMTTMKVGASLVQLEEQDGRWPPIDTAIPGGKGLVEFWVDADMLSRLLDVAAAFAGDDSNKVLVRFWSADKPVVVTAESPTQRFLGLVMPLSH